MTTAIRAEIIAAADRLEQRITPGHTIHAVGGDDLAIVIAAARVTAEAIQRR